MNENVKIAVALRAARAALGMNQQEFSDALGVAKSTVARAETMEITIKGEIYVRAIRLLRAHGVDVDTIMENEVVIKVGEKGLQEAEDKLKDPSKRRKDRKKG